MVSRNRGGRVVVYLDRVLADWLGRKSLEGYKKSTLIRRALHVYRESEMAADEWAGQEHLEGGEHRAS